MVGDVVRRFPKKVRDALKANHEVVNYPTAGTAANYVNPEVQLNVSSVGGKGSKEKDNASTYICPQWKTSAYSPHAETNGVLGQFGTIHTDSYDHPAYPTIMFAHPVLPENEWHPGFFVLPQLGIYVELRAGTGSAFSGRRAHVGTPPTRISNRCATEKIGFRINTIYYASKTAVDGSAMYSLASKPMKIDEPDKSASKSKKGKGKAQQSTKTGEERDPLFITPEITDAQ